MKRTGDWAMPATVQGQRSGCGADYQSVGHPCAEADLACRNTPEGLHTLGVKSRSSNRGSQPANKDGA